MKYDLNLNSQGYVYLPKELREILSKDIEALVNAKTIVLFRAGENLDNISKSLEVIQRDIDLRRGSIILKLYPLVEIEDRKDRIVFAKENKKVAVLKSDIRALLRERSLDEVTQTLATKLSDKGMDMELDKVRAVITKVESERASLTIPQAGVVETRRDL